MFPIITNIDSCLKSIDDHPEFIVKTDGDLKIINYLFTKSETFPNPLLIDDEIEKNKAMVLRECRGIKFDAISGNIVARPYNKFFNISEKPETQPDMIDWTAQHWILDKLDGSMVHPYTNKNGTREWHTKMGNTDIGKQAAAYVALSSLKYNDFNDSVKGKYTMIYEWCSLKNKVVIVHPEDRLILTAVRDIRTGHYMPYPEMAALAAKFGIPVVRAWEGTVKDVHDFMKEVRGIKDAEGCVLRFADGSHYKVKGEWYCLLHGTKDALSTEKNVWAMVLEETVDDLKAFMENEDRKAVDAFVAAFGAAVEGTANRLRDRVENYKKEHETKKTFAIAMANDATVPSQERGMMFSVWDGKEPLDVVLKLLRGNVGSSTKIESVRGLVDGIRWDTFYKSSLVED